MKILRDLGIFLSSRFQMMGLMVHFLLCKIYYTILAMLAQEMTKGQILALTVLVKNITYNCYQAVVVNVVL